MPVILEQTMTEDYLCQILNTIQGSTACHFKNAVTLKNALESENDNKLLDQFTESLHFVLEQDYKANNVYLDRIIKFLVTFCNLLKTKNKTIDHPLLDHIINFLVKYTRSSSDSYRYWSCKIIRHLMENIDELSEDLWEKIRDSLLERLRDNKSAIRLEAVRTLHHFQDKTDKYDPIIKRLLDLINTDYNASVRQLCVDKIALRKDVLVVILNRIRDVDINVRLTAFQRITPVAKFLTISQKHLILQCGLQDPSEKLQKYVRVVLLEEWLKAYENDYFLLMKSVRLDACKDDIKKTIFFVEHILNSLFETTSIQNIAMKIKLNEYKLIDFNDLNWESVAYYRIVIQYLRTSEEFEQVLNGVLPELVDFCAYIKKYEEAKSVDFLLHNFILEQFFLIAEGYDVSDETSRQSLNSLIHYMLQNVDLDLDVAIIIIRNLEKTIPNINDRSIFVCEIISNIMYGESAIDYEELRQKETERQHQISQIKDELLNLRTSELTAISHKKFLEADQIQNEIKTKLALLESLETFHAKPEVTKKSDVPAVSRYLTVAEAFLRSPLVTHLNPALAVLNKDTLLPNLVHSNLSVKTQAYKCYGLCCLIDLKSAKYGIHIFSAPILSSRDCDIDILVVSIKAVTDLLSLYGLSLVEKSDDEELSQDEKKVFLGGTSLSDLIQGLADLLEHENFDIQETVTKGICSLLLNNHITSSSLLARLIIKWANPATDNPKIKQFIGHTLELIPVRSDCLSYFSDVVITTVRTLVYAPRSSPLQEINVDSLAKFMVNLCQMSPEGSEIHTDIALAICSQMIDKPKAKINNTFSKLLLVLNISVNKESLDDLIQMCDQLRDRIQISQINKRIIKFNGKLQEKKIKMAE